MFDVLRLVPLTCRGSGSVRAKVSKVESRERERDDGHLRLHPSVTDQREEDTMRIELHQK